MRTVLRLPERPAGRGHLDGAGGSIGAADPRHGVAYSWIPRRMSFPGGGDPRGLGLAKVMRACLTA